MANSGPRSPVCAGMKLTLINHACCKVETASLGMPFDPWTESAGADPVILYPGQSWLVGSKSEGNDQALAPYDRVYAGIGGLPLRPPGSSVSLDELKLEFQQYRNKIYARNSRAIMFLLSRLPLLGTLRPVLIELSDLDRVVSLSVVDGLVEPPTDARDVDVVMHSSSLAFILQNDFGFDTITVNGRSEATAEGFAKMTRSLAVGSLNALGLSLSWSLLWNPRIVLILMRRLRDVLSKLARAPG